MDEMKLRFMNAVAGKLAAAPDTAAKTELVEELSDNLYRRYQDLLASGVEQEAAFGRAMEDLGDVDELLNYLGCISPDGPRPESARTAGEHDWGDWPGKEELNDLIDNVGGVVRSALEQANDALRQAKETMRKNAQEPWRPVDPERAAQSAEAEGGKEKGGWGFSFELDSDEGKFFTGAGPKKDPDVVYGFGYDKDKGGFFTQWGDSREPGAENGPVNTWFQQEDDGTYSVHTDCALRGIDVETVNGDVTVHLLEDENAPVRLGGDVDRLEVKVTSDGRLAVRQGRTASSTFFFLRGLASADVELYLPRRRWEYLQVSAANGDIELDAGVELDRLSVKTASGDLRASARCCGQVLFRSASGDIELEGLSGCAQIETASGDVRLSGDMDRVQASSASGDIELRGTVKEARLSSMSGDLRVESASLPESLSLSSKSGDCELRVPEGPFTAKFKTTSGEVSSDFFEMAGSGRSLSFDYQGGGPAYYLSSVSGDLELLKY